MTKDEALKIALDALEKSWNPQIPSADRESTAKEAMDAIKEILAQPVQPEQEPVAWQHSPTGVIWSAYPRGYQDVVPLYTSPPQRQLESTTDMMMGLAERLGELPDDVDPRAWSHLLVYAPQRQPEQEPVAWMVTYGGLTHIAYTKPTHVVDTHYQPLYASPPHRKQLTNMSLTKEVTCAACKLP